MLRTFLSALLIIVALPAFAQNSCDYANDNECDEARYGGQGYCDSGTDTADCALLSAGIEDNSCDFANDGECDEARYAGTGACQDGSDTNDCAAWIVDRETNFLQRAQALGVDTSTIQALGNNTCRWAYDNECDDARYGGTGACDAGTDAMDCLEATGQSAGLTPLTPGGGDNSCVFANDGECDEARYGGGGFCTDGTDTNDCAAQTTSVPTLGGNDSCAFANDGECDELQYGGQGFCEAGTDTTDCSGSLVTGVPVGDGDNSCEYANDNECDEARYGGGGFCADGTDAADCRQLAAGLDDDSCEWANDGECDELRYGGGGACVDGSDATDCNLYGNSPEALARLLDLVPANLRSQLGDDSCQYSNDGECDDVNFGGTVYCTPGTDASDCRALALGGEDSCRWANDGECDEPGIGTDNCTSGTDVTDCADVAFMRNRSDTCNFAFDGVCNEPGDGNGACEAFTDTADCLGRSRPAGLENHFFGRDDRFLVDTTQMPWRAIGSLELQEGSCTGTLVGPSLVLTAAHCVTDTGDETLVPVSFTAGLSRGTDQGVAKVTGAVFDPSYTPETMPEGEGNGTDWALVTLDQPLGDEVGYLDVHELTDADLAQIGRSGLIVNQAGYSWDTGDNMSGNEGCRVVEAFDDNSILHECDTAQGDSGSPFLLNVGGEWKIIAVDSQFFEDEDNKTPFGQANLAVDSRAFAIFVQQQQ